MIKYIQQNRATSWQIYATLVLTKVQTTEPNITRGQRSLVNATLNLWGKTGLPFKTMFLVSSWVSTPSRTSIRSAISAQPVCMADRLSDAVIINRNSTHVMHSMIWPNNIAAASDASIPKSAWFRILFCHKLNMRKLEQAVNLQVTSNVIIQYTQCTLHHNKDNHTKLYSWP